MGIRQVLSGLFAMLCLGNPYGQSSITIVPGGNGDPNEKIIKNGVGIDHRSADQSVGIGTYVDNSSAYIQTHTDHSLSFATNNYTSQMLLNTAGNLGIGVANPQYILDAGKRARIRYGTETAGIWFSKTNNLANQGAFFGNSSDTETGIFIGNNWRLLLNESGVLKLPNLAGSGTRNVAADANGNLVISNLSATAQVAFSVVSTNSNPATNTVTPDNNTAIRELTLETINYDLSNNVIISETDHAYFTAPVSGVYHFTANLLWQGNAEGQRAFAIRNYSGNLLSRWINSPGGPGDFGQNVSCDLYLAQGTIVGFFVGHSSSVNLRCTDNYLLNPSVISGFLVK